MMKTKFGLICAVVAFAAVALVGTFVSLQQGPPGELAVQSLAQTYPASFDVGTAAATGSLAIAVLGLGLGFSFGRSGDRLRSSAARAFAYMIVSASRLVSVAIRALVPVPHFKTSR